MNRIAIRILQKARRIASRAETPDEHGSILPFDSQGQSAGDLIREKLLSSRPCMIARCGHTELKTVLRRLRRQKYGLIPNIRRYVRGRQGPFWWDDQIRWEMMYSSGFFPTDDVGLERFADRFLADLGQIDVLGSWLRDEVELADYFPHARVVPLPDLEPFFHGNPWTTALEGRRVLVVHPFERSIRTQYEKRAILFSDPRMLPNFTLMTLKAVQSLGGNGGGFETWFEALDWMCARVHEIEFDVALIGAGAYGLSLAAFVKGIGKKAVHLGGATQLLFGIRGRRWDERPQYQRLINSHWVRPLPEETPTTQAAIDSGKSYW